MAACLSVTGGSSSPSGTTGLSPNGCEPEPGLGLGTASNPSSTPASLPPASAAVEDIPTRLGLTEAAVQARYPNLQPGDRIVFSGGFAADSPSLEEIGKPYGINAETMSQHNPYHRSGEPAVVPLQNDTVCSLPPPPEPWVSKPEGVCEADLVRAQAADAEQPMIDRVLAMVGASDPVGLKAAERFQRQCEAMPDAMREADLQQAQQELAAYDAQVVAGNYTLSAPDAIALRQQVDLMRDVYTPTDGPAFEVAASEQEQLYPQWQELKAQNDYDAAVNWPFTGVVPSSAPTGNVAADLQAEQNRRTRLDFVISATDLLGSHQDAVNSPTPAPVRP